MFGWLSGFGGRSRARHVKSLGIVETLVAAEVGRSRGHAKSAWQGAPSPPPQATPANWRELRQQDPEWQKRHAEREAEREARRSERKQDREAWRQERDAWRQEKQQWRQQWQQMQQQKVSSPAPAPVVVPAAVVAATPVVAAPVVGPAPEPQITPTATKPTQAEFDAVKTEWLRSISMLNRARSGVGFSTKTEMDRAVAQAQADFERAASVYHKMKAETGFSGYRRFAGYRRPGNLAGIFTGWDRSM